MVCFILAKKNPKNSKNKKEKKVNDFVHPLNIKHSGIHFDYLFVQAEQHENDHCPDDRWPYGFKNFFHSDQAPINPL